MPRTKTTVVDATTNAPFEIKLRSPMTAGYEWSPDFDSTALSLLSHRRLADTKKVGASAVEVFRFRSSAQGEYEIRFVLSRPWEKRPVERTRYAVRVS